MVVDILDVGQGSAAIIHVSHDECIIIDTGDQNSALPQWLGLRRKNLKIRHLILTHWHKDHIGAAHQLSKISNVQVESIVVVPPHDRRKIDFQDFLRPFRAAAKKNPNFLKQARSGDVIWEENQFSLVVKYPDDSHLLYEADINNSSMVISLIFNGKHLITWPSDNRLQTIKNVIGSKIIGWCVAPHHGAPADVLSKKSKKRKQSNIPMISASDVMPTFSYVSVGTHNTYDHPSIRLIRPWAKNAVRVICSQITRGCSFNAVNQKRNLTNSHASYGYPINHNGVACRGPLRLYWNGCEFKEDRHSLEHLDAIKSLTKPSCLVPLARSIGCSKADAAELFKDEIRV